MSGPVTTETPAQLFKEFRDALDELESHTAGSAESVPFYRAQMDADMEVLIAAWYRLHVATEPES